MVRLLLFTITLMGCGPVLYASRVPFEATDAVARAERANASKLAPYWMTRARLYLEAAQRQASQANFDAANRYGAIATAAARRAEATALERSPDEPLP